MPQLDQILTLDAISEDLRWYKLASTAPNCVDDNSTAEPQQIDSAIKSLAKTIIASQQAAKRPCQIILYTHGFNNPPKVVDARIKNAQKAVEDGKLDDPNTFWICYQWPSETIFLSPLVPLLKTIPDLLKVLAGVGVLGLFVGLVALQWLPIAGAGVIFLATLFLAFLVVLFKVADTAYYRDMYRAREYGVPDLVEFFRRLDNSLAEEKTGERVRISFIGHSMGAQVVTNTVRILSDVFSPASIRPSSEQAKAFRPSDGDVKAMSHGKLPGEESFVPASQDAIPPELGHSLALNRIVLVSPDIPGETLLSNRANFLASALHRCSEAYLFSNGGDVVLNLTGFPSLLENLRPQIAWVMSRSLPTVTEYSTLKQANFFLGFDSARRRYELSRA
jgi:hypothetical protein